MTSLAALLLLSVPTQATADAIDANAAADAMIAELRTQIDKPKRTLRLLVTFTVKPDREQEFVDLFGMATTKTRTEDGNITYMMSKVYPKDGEPSQPTYVLFETWKNLDALDQHMHTDYLAEVLTTLPEITDEVDIKVMAPQLTKEHQRKK